MYFILSENDQQPLHLAGCLNVEMDKYLGKQQMYFILAQKMTRKCILLVQPLLVKQAQMLFKKCYFMVICNHTVPGNAGA